MSTKVKMRCPHCRGLFPFDPDVGFPELCPNPKCGYEGKPHDDTVICMPSLRSAKLAINDKTYRELEKSSETRAALAASQLGVPVSEMSDLKVTNIRDNCRPGEIAAMPVVNDVTRHMEAMKQRGGQFGFTGGSEFAAGTNTGAVIMRNPDGSVKNVVQGIEPRAGARAMGNLQKMLGK